VLGVKQKYPTDARQIAGYCILLCFDHHLQTEISHETFLGDSGTNECRIVAISQQAQGDGQRSSIDCPVVLTTKLGTKHLYLARKI
jgi:hypothetical protein